MSRSPDFSEMDRYLFSNDKSRIDENNWGETALTFLFFSSSLFYRIFFFFKFYSISFRLRNTSFPFSLNTREMLSYPINFFIRDSFVLEEYLYSSYKKNFYLIKNTKLTAFLVETNNLLNGILSYFFFFFSLLFHRSDTVLGWFFSYVISNINLSQEKLKKKYWSSEFEKNLKENWRRFYGYFKATCCSLSSGFFTRLKRWQKTILRPCYFVNCR